MANEDILSFLANARDAHRQKAMEAPGRLEAANHLFLVEIFTAFKANEDP